MECIPSNPDLSIQWIFYPTDGDGLSIFIGDSQKRNIQGPPLFAESPYHNITINNADVSFHNGVYVCSIETQRGDPTVISHNITVNVLPGHLHIRTYIATCLYATLGDTIGDRFCKNNPFLKDLVS